MLVSEIVTCHECHHSSLWTYRAPTDPERTYFHTCPCGWSWAPLEGDDDE